MTTLFYIGVLLFISYLIFILRKIGIKKLPSLSHSYYELDKQGWMFQLTLVSMVFLLMPQLLEITPVDFQFVAFLAAAPLMFVGVAPNFMSEYGLEKEVHLFNAYASGILSFVLVILYAIYINWLAMLLIPLSSIICLLLYIRYKQLTFFIEMAAFGWLIGSAILLQILK